MIRKFFIMTLMSSMLIFMLTCCGSSSASFMPNTLEDLDDPYESLYFYGMERSGGNWYIKALETGEENQDLLDFLYLPVSDDVYAEFQDPEWVGAWSPEQYLSAGDLDSGYEKGKVQEGAVFTFDEEDGIITQLYEVNYYE